MYLKNASVALCSAKINNPKCDVVFATNINQVPSKYLEIFDKYNIRVEFIPFDTFVFPNEYPWSLAFYKLCVLDYFSKTSFDNFCYMDTDIYVQNSFEHIWKECQSHILLYDINHGLQIPNYIDFCEEVAEFTGNKSYFITHYGGEFYAGNYSNTQIFIKTMKSIYSRIHEKNFMTHKGDEFILSLAASETTVSIKNAGAYIHRFWTGVSFRLISTCYKYDAISVLHLPAEKEYEMLKLFNLLSKGKIDNIKREKVWKICHLSRITLKMRLKIIFLSLRKII